MKLPFNNLNLNVEVWGAGPPLLLLHGFTGSAATWAPFATEWPGRTLIAVDLPGHGKSGSPAEIESYTMDATTAALAAVLDNLGIDKVAVLGYSLGARVALPFALPPPHPP